MKISKTIEMEKDKTVRRRRLRWEKKRKPRGIDSFRG